MHIIFGQYAFDVSCLICLSVLLTSPQLHVHVYYFTMKGFVYNVYCIFLQDQR